MDTLALLNRWQHDFPLVPAPFAAIAAVLGNTESEVIAACRNAQAGGVISRIGGVWAAGAGGAAMLCALAVPASRLEAVAAQVDAVPGVNHNYEREHRYNLWFVVTAASEGRLQATLGAIEKAAGHPLLALPLLEEFHIDLGFSLQGEKQKSVAAARPVHPAAPIGESERRLVSVLQEGLPFFIRPFALIAERIGASESEVLIRIRRWLDEGDIKRFGVVVRHRELGYTANAMLVHDVPDDQVSEIGRALAEEAAVTLCYRRPRSLPDWPYNLFCMIHGRERGEVEAIIADLRQRHGLSDAAHEVLFSLTRYKQNGARYA